MFLRIENSNFGFVMEDLHKINSSDIKITEEDYDNFFQLQSKGKQFKLKTNPSGNGLFDYVEEYLPEIKESTTPTIEDRLRALELTMLEVL